MSQWNFDPAHSNADFAVRHMMVTTVRGGFKDVSGLINYDPDNVANSSVEATIQTATVWTGIADRDAHLRSPDFLDSENFPEMIFKSTRVEANGKNKAKVTGDLTIRSITKSVVLEVEFLGEQKNPFTGVNTIGFTAHTSIEREAWGLSWNQALETGGWLVGKEVKITLDVEGIPVTAAKAI